MRLLKRLTDFDQSCLYGISTVIQISTLDHTVPDPTVHYANLFFL